ncbi:hypothetical protein MC885_017975, partial [Smutsia gigantea]
EEGADLLSRYKAPKIGTGSNFIIVTEGKFKLRSSDEVSAGCPSIVASPISLCPQPPAPCQIDSSKPHQNLQGFMAAYVSCQYRNALIPKHEGHSGVTVS